MPTIQTCGGIFSRRAGAGMNRRATSPTSVPIAKVMAESRSGGTAPEASVSSASDAHMATAEKPISVARPMSDPRSAVAVALFGGFEPLRLDGDRADLCADRGADGAIYPGRAERRKRDRHA